MKRKITAVVAAFALVAAACGDDDDDAAEPPEDPTEETDPEDTDPEETDPEEAPDDDTLVAHAQDINPVSRDELQQGGEFRYPIASLPNNWNTNHPVGNESDYSRVRSPMEHRLFTYTPEGEPEIDENFLLEYELDEGPPQVVTYRLNPDAVWNDGTPITVEDFVATWEALNGDDEDYEVVTTEGYDEIVSVEQGADEFEVVVTFDTVYPDWMALFTPGLHRAESVADAETFNEGWTDPEPNTDWFTGAFIFDSLDQAQQVIELVPNPNWWGDEPLLDTIQFRAVSLDAQPQAFANDELDAVEIGPDPDGFQIASAAGHADIRTAEAPDWRQFTFNHEAGLIQDRTVRQAISMGLDRTAIGESDLAGIPWPVEPLNNHILVASQEGYEDNSEGFDYDPDAARALLEDDGWEEGSDGVYERDGERLTVTFTQITGVPVSENEARLAQDMLADIGIEVEIASIATDAFGTTLDDGEFEVMAFSWIGTPFPFRGVDQIYGTGGDSNYANSNMPDLDALVPAINTELDVDERTRLANDADRIIWEEMHTLPLYQRPQIYGVHQDLANFGAFGLIRFDMSARWQDVGWTQ